MAWDYFAACVVVQRSGCFNDGSAFCDYKCCHYNTATVYGNVNVLCTVQYLHIQQHNVGIYIGPQ